MKVLNIGKEQKPHAETADSHGKNEEEEKKTSAKFSVKSHGAKEMTTVHDMCLL